MKRSSAVLLHITSLPSPYGVGTFGKAARRFIDLLSRAGVGYWQLLPLGPTGFGNSPYQSVSTFAGNPYLIDLEALISEGLLTRKACAAPNWGDSPERVDFGALWQHRLPLLLTAFLAEQKRDPARMQKVLADFSAEMPWLEDYAQYMSIKFSQNHRPFWQWPAPLRDRDPKALQAFAAQSQNAEEIAFWKWNQWRFFTQLRELKAYAAAHGVSLLGDLPIYVSADSADVWVHRKLFLLDPETGAPNSVAGVPPDAFTADGQLWGNPLYNWQAIREDDWRWWIARIGAALQIYDLLRIDHFRGFESFWAVPVQAKTARDGHWMPGPGMQLFDTLRFVFGQDLPIIAEDLGVLTDEVRQLLHQTGLPGMKVLQFAFTKGYESDYLPHRHIENAICYTGTHDNDTLRGWLDALDAPTAAYCRDYLGLPSGDEVWGVIRAAWASPCRLAVTTAQDLLGLGSNARLNLPGSDRPQNWCWRMTGPALLPKAAVTRLRALGELYYRV